MPLDSGVGVSSHTHTPVIAMYVITIVGTVEVCVCALHVSA